MWPSNGVSNRCILSVGLSSLSVGRSVKTRAGSLSLIHTQMYHLEKQRLPVTLLLVASEVKKV